MTIAVCLKCGSMKHGAWTLCPECKHIPKEEKDKAEHVIATDHHFDPKVLEDISARVKQGLPVQFDPKAVEEFMATAKEMESEAKTGKLGCIIAALVGTGVMTVIAMAVWMIWKFVSR